MEKKFTCNSFDKEYDCDYAVCARTEEELIPKVEEHYQKAHGIKGFSEEFYGKVRASLVEGSCELESDTEMSCEDWEESCDCCC